MELKYSNDSVDDLHNILKFISNDSPTRALEFIEKIKSKIELLLTFPSLGINCKNKGLDVECRVMIFEAYLIFYRVSEREIFVISIINSAEDYIRTEI